MALTAAEKQKRYREKLKKDREKYEEAKRKHREHYHKTKRLVKDLTPKEKKNANMIWKLRQRQYRQNKRHLQNILTNTPPSSPASSLHEFQMHAAQTPPGSPASTASKQRGRKKVKKAKSKVYRENSKLKEDVAKWKKKYEKYKKRSMRAKNKSDGCQKMKTDVHKYKLLTNSIKERYKIIKSHKQKKMLKSIFKNERVEKSGKKTELFKDAFGITREYAAKKSSINPMLLRTKIRRFYLRDDISRATAGRKETITKKGDKAQKRYLLDTQKNLYNTFKAENPNLMCSYFYFTKNRPFFVVKPSVDAREMCMCKTHANFTYKVQALKKKGVIATDNLSTIIKEIVCDDFSKECMYNECDKCKNKKIKYNEENNTGTLKYSEWIRKEEQFEKDGKKMKSIKNIKEEKTIGTPDLIEAFEKDIIQFKKHVFNIKIQFQNFRECLNNLRPNECAMVVDFSENYACKYHQEVQSHHFGGSRNQVSLHTVMVYTYHPDTKYTAHSFCTVSSSNCHQPAAIWAHLKPILKWIEDSYAVIDTVHFFSDGPSTQYRQKQNFHLLCTLFFDNFRFAATSWSFFEAGHGKGPADGIGGFLKRTADKIVATGKDISNAAQFMEQLKDTSKINLFYIEEERIKEIQDYLPTNIPRLIGTLKVHQIFTENRNTLKYRSLSCFCGTIKRGFCDCLNPQDYNTTSTPSIQESFGEEICASNSMSVPPVQEVGDEEAPLNNEVPLSNAISNPSPQESSDEDHIPLSSYVSGTKTQSMPLRKSIYKAVYGSSSDTDCEEAHITSAYNTGDRLQVSEGDFLHVNVNVDSGARKKKVYSYVCKALTPIEEDGELKVMFLRIAGKDAKKFRLDEQDVSYVDWEDIIKVLPTPTLVKKGSRFYYYFESSIDVYEK